MAFAVRLRQEWFIIESVLPVCLRGVVVFLRCQSQQTIVEVVGNAVQFNVKTHSEAVNERPIMAFLADNVTVFVSTVIIFAFSFNG